MVPGTVPGMVPGSVPGTVPGPTLAARESLRFRAPVDGIVTNVTLRLRNDAVTLSSDGGVRRTGRSHPPLEDRIAKLEEIGGFTLPAAAPAPQAPQA